MADQPTIVFVHKDHPMDVTGVNSGAEMATIFLARYLAKKGARVVVYAQLKGAPGTEVGVEYRDLGPSFDVKSAISEISSEGEYHLISAGRAVPVFESQGDANCLKRFLISHDRSGNDTGISPTVLCHNLDRVICVSHAQAKVFTDAGAPSDKVTVIHNGVDHELFPAGDIETRDLHKLVFVGALVQDKGLHLLIESFCQLKAKYPKLSLDIYGSADLWARDEIFDVDDIQRRVPDIVFHGKAPQSVISESYQKAGITVVPSIWFDPFPLVSIEAQTTGCPVVTFDMGGLKEGVIHGESGLVLEEVTADNLTRGIDQILSQPELQRSMSKVALEKQRPYFDWGRVADSVLELCGAAPAADAPGSAMGGILLETM